MPGDDDPPVWELRALLDRLSDIDLVARLRDEGCAGPAWPLVRARLAGLCVRALHSLVLSGELNQRTKRLGRPAKLSPIELQELRENRHARATIVDDAVVAGLELVRRKGVLDDAWEPGKASFRTYAVNACLLQVNGPIRVWRTRRSPEECSGVGPDIERHPGFVSELPDPSDAVIDRQGSHDPLDHLPEHCPDWLRQAIRMRVATDGETQWKAIAAEVGVGTRKLEGALRRLREWFRTNDGEERP